MTIRQWPIEERPRERLFSAGAASLSDGELLAILLRTGSAGQSAVALGRELLGAFGGLNGLFGASIESLAAIRGMGRAKAAQLGAAMELARRSLGESMKAQQALASPAAVRDYLRLSIGRLDHEVFLAIYLDAQHRVLGSETLFRGTLTQTSVYPREVVKAALRANAAAVLFAHNHPSGVAQPSQADELLTRNLSEALRLVDIRVLDHFVVAGAQIISFSERGLL
jgi:DNA repair protein RadC